MPYKNKSNKKETKITKNSRLKTRDYKIECRKEKEISFSNI